MAAVIILAALALTNCFRSLIPGYIDGYPERPVFSWANDTWFSELSTEEQLAALSIMSFGGSDHDVFTSVVVAHDGSIYAVGYSDSTDAGFANKGGSTGVASEGAWDAVIVKYDSNLKQQNMASWGGSESDFFTSVAVAPDGSIYAAGYSYNTVVGPGNNRVYGAVIVKYDSDLKQQNMVFSSSKEINGLASVAIALDGSVYVVGTSGVTDMVLPNKGISKWDAVIEKFDSGLEQQNMGYWRGSESNTFFSVAVTPDGSICVVGSSCSADAGFAKKGSSDAVIIKLSNRVFDRN